jgi:hypothetical protein
MNKLTGLAGKFEKQLRTTAARGKPKTSRKQLLKKIDKSKVVYQTERKREQLLKKQLAKLEADLEACRQKVRGSRTDMLKMKKVLSNMDLADCNYVVMYDNGDCGYVIGGEEYSLDVDDEGELDTLLMREYRRKKRQEERAAGGLDEDEQDADFEDEAEPTLEKPELEPESDESEEEVMPAGPVFSNLRLLD